MNIGLNGNPFTYEELSETLGYAFGARCQLHTGTYEGVPEKTLVALIPAQRLTFNELTLLTQLCRQECLAVYEHDKGEGFLFWNGNVEEKMQFDEQYFIHSTIVI